MHTSPPAEVSHHDSARAAVSSTALGVCALRAIESQKPVNERIINDPFAAVLCGHDALSQVDWLESTGKSREFWIDFLAVRTRWIDDMLASATPAQLVILGAGLDSRCYRLSVLQGIPVYELDFPEVLAAKAKLLEGEAPLADLHSVSANLGMDDWAKSLMSAGFLPNQLSVWLLEGLTGYLTEEEIHLLFDKISAAAIPGSRMIVSFVGKDMQRNATQMHRYFVSDEAHTNHLLESHGWRANATLRLGTIAQRYDRSHNIPGEYPYFLTLAVRSDDHKESCLTVVAQGKQHMRRSDVASQEMV